jgi:hypothetical protein
MDWRSRESENTTRTRPKNFDKDGGILVKQRWLTEEGVAERMDGWMKETDKGKR